jgi:hypothetical protein
MPKHKDDHGQEDPKIYLESGGPITKKREKKVIPDPTID